MTNKFNLLFFITDVRNCIHFSQIGIGLARRGHRGVLLSDTEKQTETALNDELRKFNIDYYAIDKVGKKPYTGFSELYRILEESDINLVRARDKKRRGSIQNV